VQTVGGIEILVSIGPKIRFKRAFGRRFALGPFELEVGHHADLLEAREVCGIHELQMRDLVAVVPVTIRRARGSKCIEARAYGAIADGVNVDRKTGCVELLDQAGEALRIE
jgi:hypothetical protein